MARLLQAPWFIALAGCLLYLATTAALLHPEQFAAAAAAAAPAHAIKSEAGDAPSWKFRNPEFEQWIDELKREKESLAIREQQLHELQTRLEAERAEILTVTQAVYQLQSEFDGNIVRIKAQEVDNLKRQTKVISGMSPEGAVAMLNEMPDNDLVKVLFTLKPDSVSEILDAFSKMGKTEAKRAAALSERLRVVLPPPSTNSRPSSPG
jgi:flagellar motility protein MotE (MotC chaperone)